MESVYEPIELACWQEQTIGTESEDEQTSRNCEVCKGTARSTKKVEEQRDETFE